MVSTLSKSFAAAAAFGLLALIPDKAAAQGHCNLSIEPDLSQWTIRHNPLEDPSALKSFDVWLVNNGTTPCIGDLHASLNGDAYGLSIGGSARIRYTLQQGEPGTWNLTPITGESTARPGDNIHVAKNGRQLVRMTFTALPSNTVAAGFYTQPVSFSFVRSNGDTFAGPSVILGLDVSASALIGLKGEFSRPRGTAVIDLGELTEGVRALNTSLYVHSTGGYRVSISSANLGRLRQGTTAWYVDYNLKVGAKDVNLQGGDAINETSQTAHNDDYPLSVRIGDVTGKRAGEYSDTLTFTVAAI